MKRHGERFSLAISMKKVYLSPLTVYFYYESTAIFINDYEFCVVAKHKDVSPLLPWEGDATNSWEAHGRAHGRRN